MTLKKLIFYYYKYIILVKYQMIKSHQINSMFNLANYYEDEEKDYKLMKKYYLMAIKKDCIDSMFNLGSYYENEFS